MMGAPQTLLVVYLSLIHISCLGGCIAGAHVHLDQHIVLSQHLGGFVLAVGVVGGVFAHIHLSLIHISRVLGRYYDCVVWRTYRQSDLEEFAELAGVPVSYTHLMVIDPFARGIPAAAAKLAADEQVSTDAATAIMTTDTHKKEYAIQFELGGKTCTCLLYTSRCV